MLNFNIGDIIMSIGIILMLVISTKLWKDKEI